ncbi:hypothetical protein AB0M20_44005 [Actinoplanes sp. NPDC051633]|uniref:hypothetical protein n=1 Tax=Actinoplanes sp. NPDC051633 TaxID=3155670 RepID=UPI00342EFF8A
MVERFSAARAVARNTGDASAKSGGVAISGAINGPVSIGVRPISRSAYQHQVRRIAPPLLEGRNAELAELERFCTDPGDGPYRWVRAPAWAGKTALMAWFALHPPSGVHVVSFFITARWASQSNRVAFTDVVIEQLAELAGEPMPDLTDSTRDVWFLELLARGAVVCADRGLRLVLVIDGLDEDSGVTLGPQAHSIAALLPVEPPPGTKIIVAGRERPPLPADVPDGHPLRAAESVWPLASSGRAAVIRQDMLGELKRLLRGEPAELDLLGLVTAAGGGLAAADLAALTGLLEWEVEEHLNTVAGRSFATRPAP